MSQKTTPTTPDPSKVTSSPTRPTAVQTADPSSTTEPSFLQKTIWELLDKIQATNQPLPSIRAVRSMVGSGSMTTISDIVREWKLAHVPTGTVMSGFDEATSKQIVNAIWKYACPSLEKRIEEERRICEEKIAITKTQAEKLIETAQEELAEAKALKAAAKQKIDAARQAAKETVEKQRDEMAQLKGLVKALENQNHQLIREKVQQEKAVQKAIADKAAAEATLAAYRRMYPLLEQTIDKRQES